MRDDGTNELIRQFSLSGRTALVTGGSKGIGRAIARGLAGCGAEFVISGRDGAALEAAKADIEESAGVTGHCVVTDHAQWRDAGSFAARVRERVGDVDILVNNAGAGLAKALEDVDDGDIARLTGLNQFTPFALCREFVPAMKAQRWGRIINIGSLFSVTGVAKRTLYSATKGALIAFTRALAVELAESGITVNAVSPGPIKTPMTEHVWRDAARRQRFVEMIPMARWGEPQEVVPLVLLLAAETGSYITGQNMFVDGGATVG